MSAAFLQLEDLRVTRGGKTVLEVSKLEASAGRVTVVFGENGAGKTTLLLASAGLLDLQSGRVKLFGQSFHQGRAPAPKSLRQKIAFVFQDPYLFRRSVLKNLTYGLKIRGVAKTQRRERAEAVMQQVGISDLSGRPANDLSGGERKLVALGRALVLDPEALFLDEVTASLDDSAREQVLALIASLASERGKSILMATHLEGIAKRLKVPCINLKAGRIILG
jgi:ABC-type multidrug transport system ATPase subunit